MLRNTCVPEHSCGTHAGVWSSDVLPTELGIAKNIQAYAKWSGNCRR